jgi:hypothetical protein
MGRGFFLILAAAAAIAMVGCGENAESSEPGPKDAASSDGNARGDAAATVDADDARSDARRDASATDVGMEDVQGGNSDVQGGYPDAPTDAPEPFVDAPAEDASGSTSDAADAASQSTNDAAIDAPPDAADAAGQDAAVDVETKPPSCGPPGATTGWIETISAVGSGVRVGDRAVWIGDGLFVYNAGAYNVTRRGAIWNRASRTWSSINLTNAPQSLDNFGITWTGSKVVIWGGITTAGLVHLSNAGWLYDPIADSWSTMGGTGAPAARQGAIVLWTGTHVVVWDGTDSSTTSFTSGWGQLPGGMWDPTGPTWTEIPARSEKGAGTRAVWADTGLLLAGGASTFSTFGRFDFWVPPAASWGPGCAMTNARRYASLVWTGTRAIVWGGREGDPASVNPVVYVGTGLSIEPGNCTATAVAASSLSPRSNHSAVWTGSRMIVFGGNSGTYGGTRYSDGASYDPVQDQWSPLEPGTPGARANHQAFWTGTEMIIWGSSSSELAGCVYKP